MIRPSLLLALALAVQPPPPQPRPVTEELYGTRVTDPYRDFERLDAKTIDWIKAEGAYTGALLDSIPPRAALMKRMAAFENLFPAIDNYQRAGGRQFFRERAAGSNVANLMVRDARGTRVLIDLNRLNEPAAINYFLASPDGGKVAVGISFNGSEAASVSVYDAATGKVIAGPLDRAEFGLQAWSADSHILYFNRLQKLAPGQSADDKYKASGIEAWDLESPPRLLIRAGARDGADIPDNEIITPVTSTDSPIAALSVQNGAQNEIAIWLAPGNRMAGPWTRFVSHDDAVTAFATKGDTFYLLSHAHAPTFQVLAVKAGQPLAKAAVILPARPDRIVESIHVASDGLYVLARQGIYSRLLRVTGGKAEEIALPLRGDIAEAFSDPRAPGITFALESWTAPKRHYRYDGHRLSGLDLARFPATARDEFRVGDLEAAGGDGTRVPLTLVARAGARRPRPIILRAYGSYGISELPHFNPLLMTFLREGASFAVCHVRGGGELGKTWRLGGKDASKPNTWRDLIACAEDLVARRLTTSDELFILGGSAGGITVGRAMEERPDLFAGVIDEVPPANMERLEFMPDGVLETQEFGSIRTEAGFRNLMAMDSYQHVEAGHHYPPVLITMGINDPRVAPWQPAKLAARLLATRNPVLLRVDLDNGHGIGATRAQSDRLYADIFSFVFWRSGRPGWAPAFGAAGLTRSKEAFDDDSPAGAGDRP
ncbi:MAG TPA: prolyl oligopeptidase family serine peptidase [Allosphingosinicella sp.]|jgi:prolyl oligopeptidase